jgi:hypothetical protein
MSVIACLQHFSANADFPARNAELDLFEAAEHHDISIVVAGAGDCEFLPIP